MKSFRRIIVLFLFSIHCFAYCTLDLEPVLETISHLPHWDPQSAKIEKIGGGCTNHNFKVTLSQQSYFVRWGSDAPELLGLDPQREYTCTQQAASLGIAPAICLYNSTHHIMVLPFIESQQVDFSHRPTLERLIAPIKQLHLSSITFPTTFCPYQVIQDYSCHVSHLYQDSSVSSFTAPFLMAMQQIKQVIPDFKTICPCHLDCNSKNILDDGEKIWWIDWEYSAMADPLYDLSTWASAEGLNTQQMQEMLNIYLENPTSKDFAYFYIMSILVDIRWGFWCLIQAKVSTLDLNYLKFADLFFQQALTKMIDPFYEESLQLLKNDPYQPH